ncbi:MAG: pantoate--beta-alanine ligase [Anaerovoracaceae bacterium]
MIIAQTIAQVREKVNDWKRQGLTVGLVPTMGALHEGHASLVEKAVRSCDRVVASIFVNPTQFAANEDMESYPRNFEKDCGILEEKGCHMVFHPSVEEMYPKGFATYVELKSDMTRQLCGKSRPEHFKGVCTVVSKLFNIVAPDKAFFGEKDAQQLAVIRQMNRDMSFGIEIVGCPTVREKDGLAKSSRNSYLSKSERAAAAVIYKAVKAAQELIGSLKEDGKEIESRLIIETMEDIISKEPMARIDYIEAVDGMSLLPAEYLNSGDLVAVAVYVGNTRLIDNFTL